MKCLAAALILAAGLATAACAQTTAPKSEGEGSKMMPVPPNPVPPSAMTTARGEVKKIDPKAGTITVLHGPLVTLQVPAMTTVFMVKDPALLDRVKEGDKINFSVERGNGAIAITRIELVR